MIRKSIYLTLVAVFSICYHTYAQEQATEDTKRFRKNSIHATIGFAGLMGAYNVNYERMILESKQGTIQGLWAKAGAGGWGIWSSGGPYQSLMLGTLTGARSSHLELNFGIARMVDRSAYEHAQKMSDYLSEPPPLKSRYTHIRPAGSVGYRLQKPSARFFLRTGLGYPETIYFGLGTAF